MNFRHLVSITTFLASDGIHCVRFTCKGLNLGYRANAYKAGKKSTALLNILLQNSKEYKVNYLFLGGKLLLYQWYIFGWFQRHRFNIDDDIWGLIYLSYPLHPPKQQKKLQTSDLQLVQYPVLFLSGTADKNILLPFKSLLEGEVSKMVAPTKVYWIDGANHGMGVKGRTEEEIMDEMKPFEDV
ncbi:hypothetical protein AOXY_G10753 [Acipenser oxyrinchus oxyrinchus]|uniref:KANL3/Tex30 alpha/beta hydrolase-like domain-containing protein n=1 Tax=Acipenser oxyrinchus oxyrinchus TaxID=40147 RepID=A0AAD8DET0_ACIOX|nr:hypothetical protein AOXY_G10753 [Acipenser oxyrinchus oxyrinchus]